ncbi:MAG TPA: sporulation protein YunB [Symbiobacteriaceae bacterium]
MRRFRRRRFAVPRWLRYPILLGALAFLLVRLADLLLLTPLEAVAEEMARERGAEAINRVLLDRIGREIRHEDLVVYEKDQEGRIAAYRINTRQVSQVAAAGAAAVQEEMQRLSEESFRIPIGALTGSSLLAGLGPRVQVRMVPVGSVTVNIQQDFQGAGINQTRHRLWLEATAHVRIILPVMTREVTVTAHVPVSETVIVGPVPSGYYGGNVGGVTLPPVR